MMLPLAALICAVFFFFDPPYAVKISLGLWHLPESLSKTGFDYYAVLAAYGLIVCMNAILLSRVFNRLNLVDFNIYLPGLFYSIFSFASLNLSDISFLLGDFFIIMALFFTSSIKNNQDARNQAFNAAFFIALAASFNMNYAYMLLYPFITLTRIRPFIWREHTLILLAYSAVLFYLFAFYFYYEIPTDSIEFFNVLTIYEYESWLILLVIITIMAAAFVSRQRNVANPGVRTGKILSLWYTGFLLMLFSDLVSYFFTKHIGFHNAIFPALYLTFVYSHSKTKFIYRFLTYAVLAVGVMRFFNLF
jgi:hypothetical protein